MKKLFLLLLLCFPLTSDSAVVVVDSIQDATGTDFDNTTNGFTADNVQTAIDEIQCLNVGGEKEVCKDKVGGDLRLRTLKEGVGVTIVQNTDDITISSSDTAGFDKLLNFTAFSTGVTFNRWLNVEHPNNSSNEVPFIMAFDGTAIAVTFSNDTDDTDIDVEFYVNTVLQFTWQIRNKRNAFKVLNAGLFTVSQGDRVAVFMKQVDPTANPRDPNIEMIIKNVVIDDGDGGQQFGD